MQYFGMIPNAAWDFGDGLLFTAFEMRRAARRWYREGEPVIALHTQTLEVLDDLLIETNERKKDLDHRLLLIEERSGWSEIKSGIKKVIRGK